MDTQRNLERAPDTLDSIHMDTSDILCSKHDVICGPQTQRKRLRGNLSITSMLRLFPGYQECLLLRSFGDSFELNYSS